jgi:tRNA uridine 5-carbamoylmethylation protein Kti12
MHELYIGVWTEKSQLTETKKMARLVKSNLKSTLIICFDMKWIVHKEYVLAGPSILVTTVTFYGD